jgi:hypothetical protein
MVDFEPSVVTALDDLINKTTGSPGGLIAAAHLAAASQPHIEGLRRRLLGIWEQQVRNLSNVGLTAQGQLEGRVEQLASALDYILAIDESASAPKVH